ncbi:MAG: hypothetical protein U1B78_05300 [Dehalococcoidia bacterium]|nr:hypothetical protein [Dehalococcoidia bacterium]
MRILLIIFDGLADRPAPELGGKTPLEAAHTPNLDRFASDAINGLFHAKSPGYPLGSPLALHLMFGYPEAQFPDRGPLLARARAFKIDDGDVILAARFASVVREASHVRPVQRFIRGREEACRARAAAIERFEDDGLIFRYVYAGRGDGNLLISGGASFEVTDTDPLGLDLPVLKARARANAADPKLADRTAEALNRYLAWAHQQLEADPASGGADDQPPINFLITKWAGPKPALEPFVERWGLSCASLPDEEVVAGLLIELGFRLEHVGNSEPETEVRARLQRATGLLAEGCEFVHLHSKHPDPISHENNPPAVRDVIEAIDRAMEVYWRELAGDSDLITVITTDHTTPSVWAHHPRGAFNDLHSGEPVPIAIRGGNVRVDEVTRFGERAAASGALGQLRGEDLMPVLLNAAERANMYEMRPLPERRLYRPKPSDVEPFEL